MKTRGFQIVNPEKYDIATEVLSSAIRVLQAAGFSENEIPKLFEQVAKGRARGPFWTKPPER
jgi:DNA-binding transcriptional regulator YhcF (GntR family)